MEHLEFQAAAQEPACAFTAQGEIATTAHPVSLAKGDVLTACALAQCGERPATLPLGTLRVTWRRPA